MDRRLVLSALATMAGAPTLARASNERTVYLPQNNTNSDPQLRYVSDLVRLAFNKIGANADVRWTALEMQQSRSLADLLSGQAPFDLMWSMTTLEREQSGVRFVRFPIDRGLLGWRVLLVKASELGRWKHVSSLEDVKQFVAGQGHDWPDVDILKANGLPVVTSRGYDSLFRMLKVGRFDYLPRSILEADAEMASQDQAEFRLVPDVMLWYPAAAYLFVSPSQPRLADELERGLRLAANDGSFHALFKQHFGAAVQAHPIQAGRVFRLKNPTASVDTETSDLWLRPGVTLR